MLYSETQFAHGGDRGLYGRVLDFSANIHPLGMPPAVKQAVIDALEESHCYPDPFCSNLRLALAHKEGVDPHQVVCGNGAADLIVRLVSVVKPKRALVCAPSFLEYETALRLERAEIDYYPLSSKNNFEVGFDLVDKITLDTSLVFLCTPNNPTGITIAPDVLRHIVDTCQNKGCLVLLDECFLELCEDAEHLVPLAKTNEMLILLRAFTKSYGIPGIRLGYAISSNEKLLAAMIQHAQPWSVSNLAQAAGIAACACADWPEEARRILRDERPVITQVLKSLGAQVWDAKANYLFFKIPGCFDLKERLVEKGILIRSCANYQGLTGEYYRVAIKRKEENKVLIAALEEVLGNG